MDRKKRNIIATVIILSSVLVLAAGAVGVFFLWSHGCDGELIFGWKATT